MRSLTIPDIRGWNAGDQPDETMMNALQDAYDFVIAPPEIKVRRSTTFSAPSSGTVYHVPFDYVILDTCAPFGAPMWTSALPTRITAQVPGWYEITMSVSWNVSAAGNRRITALNFNQNGAGFLDQGRNETVATGDVPQTTTEYPWFMNTGDYFELAIYSESASNTLATQAPTDPTDQRYAALVRAKWVSA